MRMTVEFRTFGVAEITAIAPEGITRDEIAERFSESVLRSAWSFMPSEIGTVRGAAGWIATLDDFDIVVDRVFVNIDVDEVGVEADDDGTPDAGGFSGSLC